MKILDKLFKKKKEPVQSLPQDTVEAPIETVEPFDNLPSTETDSMDDMKKVAHTIDEIKSQSTLQALLSGSKNERALAENDALISNVIKNILNWLAAITSAEMLRKEEYDSLTTQMLQLDEDVNAQLEMQVKFKKAYQAMIAKQEEQKALADTVDALKKKNLILRALTFISLGIGCAALILAIL